MTSKSAALHVAMILASFAVGVTHGFAQPAPPREERLSFAKGATSAIATGQLKGDEDVDYLVRAAAGQTISVSLKHSNTSNYFNVIAPGNKNVAMYVGDPDGPFTALLPADGDYRIRVYLGRAAARRPNASSTYTLTVSVTGKALAPLPGSRDAILPDTRFHASASISCVPAPYVDTKPTSCQAFVTRRGNDGTATVEVPLDSESTRHILFVQGKPVASSSAEKLTFTRDGDTTTVTFESGEVYRVPDALLFGG